jgi:HlyD family secretion protein
MRAEARRSARSRAAGLLALALLAAACRAERPLDAVGTLERDRIELIAQSSDPIAEIAVREGDRVHPDQLLLRLDSARPDARVAQARALREQAQARLAEVERGPRSERIEQARARLAAARSQVETMRREIERIRVLAAQDYASRSRLEQLENQGADARARRDDAQAELDTLVHGSTREEIDQARSALAAAQATLAEIEVERGRMDVRAPSEGVVDALPFELGERPPAGAVVAVLLANSAPYARVYVPESVRASLLPGARATIHVDGHPEPFEGRLRTVAAEASFTPYFALTRYDRGRLSYLAEIDVVGPEGTRLPTGVPVEVRFESAETARHER